MVDCEVDVSMAASNVPPWRDGFLRPGYFELCGRPSHTHKTVTNSKSGAVAAVDTAGIFKKGEKKFYCIDCEMGPLCMTDWEEEHLNHSVLQVRRASRDDAVMVADIEKVLDIRGIQEYSINGSKIMFLLARPQHKVAIVKTELRTCVECGRCLTDSVQFCSLTCKMLQVLQNSKDRRFRMQLLSGTESQEVARRTLLALKDTNVNFCSPKCVLYAGKRVRGKDTTFAKQFPSGKDSEVGSCPALPALKDKEGDADSPNCIVYTRKRIRNFRPASRTATNWTRSTFLQTAPGIEIAEIVSDIVDRAKGQDASLMEVPDARGPSPITTFDSAVGGSAKSGNSSEGVPEGVGPQVLDRFRKRARKGEAYRASGLGIQDA